jgi:opacity protein-like surface antigen
VTAGGAWTDGDTQVVCDDPGGVFDTVFATPNCRFPIESGALETRYDTGDAGVLGGLSFGYNVQAGKLVAGVEIDISAASIEGEDEQFKDVPPTSPGERILVHDLKWLSTMRGRLGYASQNWLVFVTGGLAIGRLDYGYGASYSNGVATADVSETKTEIGYTLGAGGELGFGPFSLKGEYLYFDLGERDLSAQFYVGGSPRPVFFEPEFDNSGHILRLGINVPIN